MSQQKYQACMAACSASLVLCNECTNDCLNEQDVRMLTHCIRLNHECASICHLAIEAMTGGSEFVKQICNLCAEICNACANECEKHAHIDHCKLCAEACRRCAIACLDMNKI
jgi:hypothetical protein